MDIKFCKTNLLIEHKELDGRFQFKFTHPLAGPPSFSCPTLSSPQLRNADLGEPECYYFEEYEAPRMNPSVVAATRGLDFSKSSTMARESHGEDAKVHGQDGEQDQKFGEEGFWFFKQEEVQGLPLSLGVGHSSPPKGGSLPKSLTEPLLSSQGKEKTTRREGGRLPRPDAPARPPDSIESKQRKLNSIELTVELTWRSPCLRSWDSSTINPVPGLLSDWTPTTASSEHNAPPRPRKPHTLKMKKRGRGATSSIE
ncbi:unnamed protein product [Microthlaspi erraticum]|uniref:Uncharacterized protein n=1 Tax=Microthlaspi erraticum TaxID=1685480 RepID=A0A6D2JEY3_9BRAS|nr:unnamed protein product [Microthlaspi erraticum]